MSKQRSQNMLVFDSAYTFQIMTERNISVIVTARDLDGYFDHIWTVHPVAGLLYADVEKRFGSPAFHRLNDKHTVIEGKIGKYKSLRWIAPLNFLLAQWELIRVLNRLTKSKNIQFVRAEDPYYNGLMALLFSWLQKKPMLIGVWGNPGAVRTYTGKPLMKRLFKWVWVEEIIEKFVLRRADCVMIQNEDNRNFVLSKGVPKNKTAFFRVGNLIHDDHFTEPSERTDGKQKLRETGISDEKVLMCISRLEALKLTDHVIKAAEILIKKGWNIKLLFVGDGSFRSDMEALANKLEISQHIIFCSNRSQDWLAQVIPAVDVVVSPLTGRALTEAGLGGAPIVAYDIDWHGEVIRTGETGELVPYLDYKAMASSIEKLLQHPDYARDMGKNVRALMADLMNPSKNNRMQIETYEHLKHPHLKPVHQLKSLA